MRGGGPRDIGNKICELVVMLIIYHAVYGVSRGKMLFFALKCCFILMGEKWSMMPVTVFLCFCG
jgi:hypothetical protein